MKQKVLVLSTWYDGGPDEECSAWKVLDENFNDITNEISTPDFGAHYNLYHNESFDTEDGVYVPINNFLDKERVDKFCKEASYLISDELISQYRKDLISLVEAIEMIPPLKNDKYVDDYTAAVKPLQAKVHALIDELSEKYKQEYTSFPGIYIPYTEHTIGMDEFVKMNGITKVITL